MAALSCKSALVSVLVAIVAIVISNVLSTLRPFKEQPPYDDASSCTLLGGEERQPWGAEDLVLITKAPGGWVISSSIDSAHFAPHGIDSCRSDNPRDGRSGGLWAFRVGGGDEARPAHPSRLDIVGMPKNEGRYGPCFITHGLFLSDATDRLYVVTHWGKQSSIEIFKVDYHRSDEDSPPPRQQTQPPFSIRWIRSVRSDTFPNVAINDVVEGSDASELYVTKCLPFGLPIHGRKNPTTWTETIQQALLLPVFFVGLKLSYVQRCAFDPDDPAVPPRCADATLGGPSKQFRFRAANGIAINDDRTEVFVCDMMAHSIATFRRQSGTGSLEATGRIELDHACDNLEWRKRDGTAEEIWMGIIPDMVTAAGNEERGSFEERTPVSGGLAVVSRSDGGGDVGEWSGQRVVYNHDGSMLSQVSFGMVHNGKVVLGSPSAPGILVCDA